MALTPLPQGIGNLQPGSTGPAVQALQNWLVQNGLLTQDQVNTGYGTYGPQTTAAVTKLQQQLGVNNTSGPGYFGPLTTTAVTNATTGSQTGTNTTGTTTPATDRQALVGAIGSTVQAQTQNGTPPATISDAAAQAAKNPDLIAKYADALKLDTQSFQQSLQNLQRQTSTEAQNQQMQFDNDRKALAEQKASAGQAYSGIREKAQQQLGTQQSGIVQSSKATLQNNLNNLTSAFESKYGTSATNPATAQFRDPYASSGVSLSGLKATGTPILSSLSGQTAGGITGTEPINKSNDIAQGAQNILNLQK